MTGIPAVLIKADARRPCGASIDLVIPEQHWRTRADRARRPVAHSTYWLEHSATALLYPSAGPALQLHTGFSWFGVPVLRTCRLLAARR